MEKETKTCPYCGGEILAVAKKCKHCGQWLEEKKNPVDTPKQSSNKAVIGGIVGVIALALIIVLFTFTSNSTPTPQQESVETTDVTTEITAVVSNEQPDQVIAPAEEVVEPTTLRPGMKCREVAALDNAIWEFVDVDDNGTYATLGVLVLGGELHKTNILFYGQSGSELLTESGFEKVSEAWGNAALEFTLAPEDFKNGAILVE